MSPPAPAALRRRLLSWYDRSRRRMPWREQVSPYRTWISEIMLQQTTVAAATPCFERFVARFPDVAALAAASQEEVLALWAGLGYYSRARNLLKAARRLVAERGGVFPDEYGAVLDLPGIGRYTAGAILSIAFGRRVPLVDGNVMRVLSRLFCVRGALKDPKTVARFWELAGRLVPQRRPGDWNQALMELGATVCVPESPRCIGCPVAALCEANRLGIQDRLPQAAVRPEPVELRWTCLLIERGGRLLLWKRSDSERFLKGHWSLPEAQRLAAEPGRRLGTVRHTITHHKIAVALHEAAAPRRLPAEAAWIPREKVPAHLVSSLWTKCLKLSELSPPMRRRTQSC